MNVITCPNGHYYDADKFPSCPHCSNFGGMATTIPADIEDISIPSTIPADINTTPEPTVPDTSGNSKIITDDSTNPSDIQKTIGYYEEDFGTEPVVGWLVCIDGAQKGKDYRLISGRNFIGRSKKMDVILEGDPSVSREAHAVVIYEPKSNTYMIQPGVSRELSYLNDQVVLESKAIKVNDVITIGATKLMFIPCCSSKFQWTTDIKDKEDSK